MAKRQFLISDATEQVFGLIEVAPGPDGWWSGVLLRNDLPETMREAFSRLEEVINSQTLSVLDQAEDSVRQLGLGLRSHAGGELIPIEEMHVMNEGNDIALRLPSSVTNGQSCADNEEFAKQL